MRTAIYMKRGRQLYGWLYGEQVKEYQMWVTSSLPSQHNKADLIIKQFSKKSNFINSKESPLSKITWGFSTKGKEAPKELRKRAEMRNDSKLMKEIFKEIKETNRLIGEMNRSLQQMMKRMLPEKHSTETIQRGGPIAEITVRTPEKLEEWRSLFESRGMKVECHEPSRTNGEGYFAKLWGYLENHRHGRDREESVPELNRHVFLSQEKPS